MWLPGKEPKGAPSYCNTGRLPSPRLSWSPGNCLSLGAQGPLEELKSQGQTNLFVSVPCDLQVWSLGNQRQLSPEMSSWALPLALLWDPACSVSPSVRCPEQQGGLPGVASRVK